MKKIISTIGIAILALRVAAQPTPPQADLFDLYGQLTGRTILHGAIPALPSAGIQLSTDTNQIIQLIEAELAKHQIECVLDGQKFVRLVPTGWKDTAMGAQLARLELATNNASTTNSVDTNTVSRSTSRNHVFRTGDIDFPNISLDQVLDLYSRLAERTVTHLPNLPPVMISFKSQNPLTTDEVIYAFKTLFILNGFSIVDDDAKTSHLVCLRQTKK